jgi:hypothetical protein
MVRKVPVREETGLDSILEMFGELDEKDQIAKVGNEKLLNAGKSK